VALADRQLGRILDPRRHRRRPPVDAPLAASVAIGRGGHLQSVGVTTFETVTARRVTSALLAALAGLLLVAGAACWSIDHGVISEDAFADKALDALHRDAVHRAVSQEITAQVQPHVPSAAASPDQVRAIVDRTVRSASFERVFRAGALATNRALFHNDGSDATLRVNLAEVLRPTSPQLAGVVGDRDVTVLSLDAGRDLDRLSRAADVVGMLGIALPFWAVAALIGALLLAPRKGRALGAAGVGAALTGALLLAAAYVARAVAQSQIDMVGVGDTQARAAAAATWSVYTADVRLIAIVAIVAGLLLAIGGFLASLSRRSAGDRRRAPARGAAR
jgi:hypothetical protein